MNHRLTARGKQRRRQLMDYAAGRFAEHGYHPTSVADIVEGMGVGKGVFYWYFSSKEELFCEILREAQQELRRRQEQALGEEADPVRRIELGIRASMDWIQEHRHMIALFQFAASEETFSPTLRRGQEVAVADVMRHVKDGIVAGRVRDGDPLVITHAVLGVTNQLASVFLIGRNESATEVADAAVSFCLEGLLGPGESPAAAPLPATAG